MKNRKINKWKVTAVILSVIFITLLSYVTITRIQQNNDDVIYKKYFGEEMTKKNFESFSNVLMNSSYHSMKICNRNTEKCFVISKKIENLSGLK